MGLFGLFCPPALPGVPRTLPIGPLLISGLTHFWLWRRRWLIMLVVDRDLLGGLVHTLQLKQLMHNIID